MTMDHEELIQFLNGTAAVFHYTTAAIALEHILATGQIRLSPLERTNDPYEYKFAFLGSAGWHPPHLSDEQALSALHEAHPIFDAFRRKHAKVFSLTSNRVPERPVEAVPLGAGSIGACKSRMWSQYGGNHEGVCLAFDRDELLRAVEANYHEVFAGDVDYFATPPRQQFILDTSRLGNDDPTSLIHDHIRTWHRQIFLTKNIDYKDENEYRVIVLCLDSLYAYIDIRDALRCIVIGDRFPDGLFPSLALSAKDFGVKCRRVHWSNGVPHIVPAHPRDGAINQRMEEAGLDAYLGA